MLGIMYVTGFLSLWIQNTAAASMMLPIVIALVKQLSKYNKAYSEEPHMNHNKRMNEAKINVAYAADTDTIKTTGGIKCFDLNCKIIY